MRYALFGYDWQAREVLHRKSVAKTAITAELRACVSAEVEYAVIYSANCTPDSSRPVGVARRGGVGFSVTLAAVASGIRSQQ